jgi:4-hydroxy-2-oxoheptanedioate aldolase
MSAPGGNALRPRLAQRELLLGGWCTLPTSFAAELVGSSGVDYAVVDMQHGLTGYSDLISMLQAISLAGAVPIVRMPFSDYGLAQRALDAGAMGLILPMVNNAALATDAVRSCRYPPLGERSFGPIRAKLTLGMDPAWANEQVLCLVQIETREAMTNLDAILAVPGLDGVYVGPADLALSHGLPAGRPSPELDALLSRIVQACDHHGRIPGIHTLSGVDCRHKIALGYRMCSIGSDSVWLHGAYTGQVAVAREQEASAAGGLY